MTVISFSVIVKSLILLGESIEKFYRVNDKIRVPRVLLIDENGDNHGEKNLFEAQQLARVAELDLVEIAPNSRPPVCRIMDFGKFKYDLAKQSKQNKAKKESELKETRLTANISDHDLGIKAKQAATFIDKGNIVRVTMRLKGRENIFADRALSVFENFKNISNLDYENPPKKQGSRIEAILIRKKGSQDGETQNPQSNG